MSDSKDGRHRVCCPACNKDVRLRKCGRFFVHGPLEARCQMSDQIPHRDLSPSPQTDSPSSVQPDLSLCFGDPKSLLSDIRFVKGRILRFVPRGARVQWATTLTECVDRILQDPGDPGHWRSLMLAPSLCLKVPQRGGHNRRSSLTSLVNKQCSAFRSSSDLLSLASPANPHQSRRSKANNNHSRLI